jgi:nitronate monooxygenase
MNPDQLFQRTRLPLIGAPMTGVSSTELVIACCRAGIIGTIPASNARSTGELAEWLTEIDEALAATEAAPYGVNFPLYTNEERRRADINVAMGTAADLIIPSVGSPAPVMGPSREAGKIVYADVATMRHAKKSIELGVDGLILLTAGAGGFTGWMNPFVFVRGVREVYEGPIVLAGGIADGVALDAALRLGCTAAYLGTALISVAESGATAEFQHAVLAASMDDVRLVAMPNGLNANGVTPDGVGPTDGGAVFSMGHTAHAVRSASTVRDLVDRLAGEFEGARSVGAPT